MARIDDAEKPPSERESEILSTAPSAPSHESRRVWERLGYLNLAILALGTVVVLLCLAFLIFVWIVSINAIDGGSSPPLWRAIVQFKTARVITILSVLIRITTATQLGIFAAILAALLLERVGVQREVLPCISMIRCLKSSPNSLALSIYNSMLTRPFLPYSFLLIIAILDALALQFATTILLTDFKNRDVVIRTTTRNITFEYTNGGQ